MTDEEAYADSVAELNEKLAKARALDPGQYEKAKELFRDVMNTASGLVGEVEKGGRVLITEQQSMETAIGLISRAEEGLAAAGKKAAEETATRLKEQQEMTQKLLTSLNEVVAKFDLLARRLAEALDLKINVDAGEIDTAIDKMRGLEEEKSWCDQLFDEPFIVKTDTDAVAAVGDAVRAEAREIAESPIGVRLEDNVVDVEENIKAALARVHEAGEAIPVDLSAISSIEELERLAREVHEVQEETGKPLHFAGISTGDIDSAIYNIGLFKIAMAELRPEEPVTVDVEVTGEQDVKSLAEYVTKIEDKEAEVEAIVIGYDEVSNLVEIIGDLKNATIRIKAQYDWEGSPVGAYDKGGPARGQKEIPAVLHAGEFVLCAEAVRAIGLRTCHFINKRLLGLRDFAAFQAGGSVFNAVKSPPMPLTQLKQVLPSMSSIVGGAQSTTVNRKDFNINISMAGGRAPKLSGRARRLLDQLSDEMDFLTARGASFG